MSVLIVVSAVILISKYRNEVIGEYVESYEVAPDFEKLVLPEVPGTYPIFSSLDIGEYTTFELSDVPELKQFESLDYYGRIICQNGPDYLSYLDQTKELVFCKVKDSKDYDISGGGLCGHNGLEHGKYVLLSASSKNSFSVYNNLSEIKQGFSFDTPDKFYPILRIMHMNLNPDSIYYKQESDGFLIQFYETPSACSCGRVYSEEYIYKVYPDGEFEVIESKKFGDSFRGACIN